MGLLSTISYPLHQGQHAIETSSLTQLRAFTQVIVESPQDGMPAMGIAYSKRAGIGKSTGVVQIGKECATQAHTGTSGVVLIELEPYIAVVGFLETFLDTLGERPRGRTKTALVRQSIEAVKGNDLRLIIFDEANWFASKVFEMARYIHGQTRCPMLLVGLEDILKVIEPFEQLKSRAFLRHEFKPLKQKEFLRDFLPGLAFSRWSFDQKNADDQTMGKFIWRIVRPSLRRTTFLVQTANKVAVENDDPKVTVEHIKAALALSDVANTLKNMEEAEAPNDSSTDENEDKEEVETESYGPHEERSEKKHAAKHGRGEA
jgi:hypothetical protein